MMHKLEAKLYPNPQGQFYFNFRPYISALINTRNFEDTTDTDIDTNSLGTYCAKCSCPLSAKVRSTDICPLNKW